MKRGLKRWAGKITSHGIHMITGKHDPFYGVNISIELEREEGRHVDVTYRDAEEAEYFGHSLVRIALTSRKHNISQAAGRFRLAGGQTDVHTEHCCDRHGCKYGADETDECTVVNESKPQSHLCEQCEHELEAAEAAGKDLLDFRNDRMKARRTRKAGKES